MYKSLLRSIAIVAVAVGVSTTSVYAAETDYGIELKLDGVFCNSTECDVTITGWATNGTPLSFEWRHNLDKTGWTNWTVDDDIYHIIVPADAFGKHRVAVKLRLDDNQVIKGNFAFELKPEGIDLVAEDLYCTETECDLTVGVFFNGELGNYNYSWSHKLDNKPRTEWVVDDDFYHIAIPRNATGNHRVKVWVRVENYVYLETFNVIVPAV